MNELSQGAALAWKIAAAEAAAARHARIDRPHLLIGVLSLGKAVAAARGLPADERTALTAETARVEGVLARFGLVPGVLRRSLRERLGVGAHRHKGSEPVSRTAGCKAAFERAQAFAALGPTTSLHLLAALAEGADPSIDPLLRDAGVKPVQIRRQALALAHIDRIAAALRSEHGVGLSVDEDAERFLGTLPAADDLDDQHGAVERFVAVPLTDLVRSGKIRRAASWRVVHEEGGIYVIPADEPAPR